MSTITFKENRREPRQTLTNNDNVMIEIPHPFGKEYPSLIHRADSLSNKGFSFITSTQSELFFPETPLKKVKISKKGTQKTFDISAVRYVTPLKLDQNFYRIGVQIQEPSISPSNIPINFEITQEQKALRDKVKKFVQDEISPKTAHYDQTGEFPWDILRKAYDLGLFSCYLPKKYGGEGLGLFETALITEELGAGCMAMGTSIMINLLGTSPLLIAGNEDQKQKYLSLCCQQLTLFSFCFTEPDAGSDPSRISTKAERKGDHYVLNGSKCFITNGGVSDYYIVFATLDKNLGTKGLTAFLTPSNAKGIRRGKILDKMGQRASNTSEIFFNNVKIPFENRIGNEGEGYKIGLKSISRSRINVASGAVGIGRTAMENALHYVQKRHQFNQPLGNFQYVQFRLTDMATLLDAARALTWRAAWRADQGENFVKESSMAKDFAGDVVMKVTSEALDLFGGYGYSKLYPMEKLMRDAKLMQIYEGPSPIHKTIIYREIAKEYGY